MAWCINDSEVPLLSVELLGGAGNSHTALTLFLLTVHVEGESERALAQTLCLLLQLLQLTLGKTTKLKDKAPGRGALATVDVPADDDGKMLLLRVGNHCCYVRRSRKDNLL